MGSDRNSDMQEPNAQLLEEAKIFYKKGATLNSVSYNASLKSQPSKATAAEGVITKPIFFKVMPLWKEAFVVNSKNNLSYIVIPTKENELKDKTYEVRRFFLFTKKGDDIVDGRIIEIMAHNYSLENKIYDIIASYESEQISNLTGAIFIYDLNYFFKSSVEVKGGQKLSTLPKFSNLEKNDNARVKTMDLTGCTSCNPNVCYQVYLVHYLDGVEQSRDFIGYSDGCYPTPPSGSDSGYDTSGNYYGGGSAPYGGNEEVPVYRETTNVILSADGTGDSTSPEVLNSPFRPMFHCNAKIVRLMPSRIVDEVYVDPITVDPVDSFYKDMYGRDTHRYIRLTGAEGDRGWSFMTPTSIKVWCGCTVIERFTYIDGSPAFVAPPYYHRATNYYF